MPEQTPGSGVPAQRPSGVVVEQAGRSAAMIKTGSRLGVWGLAGGIGAMTAFTLGAPVSLPTAMLVMGAGVLVSGLGTVLASVGVLGSKAKAPKVVQAAALAGTPLGLVLGLLGVTGLTQWAPLVAIVHALTPAAGILGAVVVLLLVVGLVVDGSNEDDEGQQ